MTATNISHFIHWLTTTTRDPNAVYIIFRPVSVIFHCVCTENIIFAPTIGRLDTLITALYCISGEKLLG